MLSGGTKFFLLGTAMLTVWMQHAGEEGAHRCTVCNCLKEDSTLCKVSWQYFQKSARQ